MTDAERALHHAIDMALLLWVGHEHAPIVTAQKVLRGVRLDEDHRSRLPGRLSMLAALATSEHCPSSRATNASFWRQLEYIASEPTAGPGDDAAVDLDGAGLLRMLPVDAYPYWLAHAETDPANNPLVRLAATVCARHMSVSEGSKIQVLFRGRSTALDPCLDTPPGKMPSGADTPPPVRAPWARAPRPR